MERLKKIVKILIESDKPMTTEEISSVLGVTSRTIRTDLKKIEKDLAESSLSLQKRPKIGVWIEGSKTEKDDFLIQYLSEQKKESAYSKDYRQTYISMQLLLKEDRIFVYALANYLMTSTATIEKDLKEIQGQLEKYHLEIHRSEQEGLKIEGDEINVRNAISSILNKTTKMNDMLQRYARESLINIEKVVTVWNLRWNVILDQYHVHNLAMHIQIMLARLRQRKRYSLQAISHIHKEFMSEAFMDLIQDIEKVFSIEIHDDEAYYLWMHVEGMALNQSEKSQSKLLGPLKAVADEIVNDFVCRLEQLLDLDLKHQNEFKEALVNHLIPTIYRMKRGLNLYNPLLQEIQQNYSGYYTLAGFINASFEKHLQMKASPEELAFIAMHISVLIESVSGQKKIAIVCQLGQSISRYLVLNLEKHFPKIQFINCGVEDLPLMEPVDVVVSTVPINTDIPSVQVSALLTDLDLSKIKAVIRESERLPQALISPHTILKIKGTEKSLVIEQLSKRLEYVGSVKSTFYEGVLRREQMGSTEIGDGIVLTHGFHEDVKVTKLAMAILEEPMKWNSEWVDVVVCLAISKKDAKNVMQMDWLYKLLMNKEKLDLIRKCKSVEEIYGYLLEAHLRK